jgi:hypothetical protein
VNDQPTPFAPFLPDPPNPAPPAPQAPKTRRKRAAKTATKRAKAVPVGQHDPEPAPAKRARKTRQPRPATVSIDLLLVASGLDEKAAQVFAGMVQALSHLRKPSRRKLIEALQKLS